MGGSILLVAGEASADLHGAALLAELKKRVPDVQCFGVGDERLKQQGMDVVVEARSLNVVGGADWLDRLGEVLRSYRQLLREIRRRRPDCAVLLDLPDFNLRLAGQLKRLGIPVVYYISPQVWAWRRYRVRKIRRVVDEMLVVFPFEKRFYDGQRVRSEFVGHPLLDSIRSRSSTRSAADVRTAPRVALLPGSRLSEIRYHAPLLVKAAQLLRERHPAVQIRIPVATTLPLEDVEAALWPTGAVFSRGDSRDVVAWADVAAVCSGTATLETALIGTPFCLFYILSSSSAWIGRHVLGYRGFFGLPNVLSGREVAKELIQEGATPEALSSELIRLIEDEPYRDAVALALKQCRSMLGEPGASSRVAERVARVLATRERGEGAAGSPS